LPVPFDQRADYLLESDLGVIVQASNFETQLSARTRALDYLWANLPIFINRGDEIGELVARHGIGIVAESNDPAELQRVLLDYVRDPARRERTIAAVREVKKNFLWSSTVRPILRFCQGVAK
jgi:glycosyltransferase involved in cell wall biosynthesis